MEGGGRGGSVAALSATVIEYLPAPAMRLPVAPVPPLVSVTHHPVNHQTAHRDYSLQRPVAAAPVVHVYYRAPACRTRPFPFRSPPACCRTYRPRSFVRLRRRVCRRLPFRPSFSLRPRSLVRPRCRVQRRLPFRPRPSRCLRPRFFRRFLSHRGRPISCSFRKITGVCLSRRPRKLLARSSVGPHETFIRD